MTMWLAISTPEVSVGDDEGRADEVRLALVRAAVYPTAPLEGDAGLAVFEAVAQQDALCLRLLGIDPKEVKRG